MVGLIKNKDLLLKFEGYVNSSDTAKKIYRDVFEKGDQVFASGDILYWDELGYLYFKDRRGDTFRFAIFYKTFYVNMSSMHSIKAKYEFLDKLKANFHQNEIKAFNLLF